MSRKGSFSYGSKGAPDVTSINRKSGNVDLSIADLGEVVNIAAGASYAFNMETDTRHIFFCCGGSTDNICGVVASCYGAGSVRSAKMGSASNITLTNGTNKLTIKSASYTCCVLHLSYKVPT